MPERIPLADEATTRCTPVCFSRERNKQDVSLKQAESFTKRVTGVLEFLWRLRRFGLYLNICNFSVERATYRGRNSKGKKPREYF